jgi:hypothetical protein
MRSFGLLFNKGTSYYSVIYQDENSGMWYVYLNDIAEKSTAQELVEALNIKENQ